VEWALFTLTFIFGYITCKVFYFIRAARASFQLLRASQLISVALLVKSMEDFYYAKIYRMEKMVEAGESDHNITAFSYRIEEEVDYFKKKSVQGLVDLHPQFFHQLLEFKDWKSAMNFLEANKDVVASFLSRSEHD
jgi:hypothetical protein|tara:strand:- start:20 stop:427 length:408 start_codon:yes stop_codon:yes gene_type:complete